MMLVCTELDIMSLLPWLGGCPDRLPILGYLYFVLLCYIAADFVGLASVADVIDFGGGRAPLPNIAFLRVLLSVVLCS